MKAETLISQPLSSVPIERLTRTFHRFEQIEGFSGIVLLAAALVGLSLANSRWAEAYFTYLDQHIILGLGQAATLDLPLSLWINDGLMAIFFFVVGLEIKREVLIGELSSPRKAALPFLAAVGGMIVPAGIYLIFNAGRPGQDGWGIPMATDIAFALGVLALLSRREAMLHPWVAYLIMPIFAFANAGVALSAETVRNLASSVGLGILVGLVIGKFAGILLATFLAVRLKLANLPRNVRWSHIVGVACLGGMGFTMSLFIASLAFGDGSHATALAVSTKLASPAPSTAGLDQTMHDVAKLAILTASLIAGLLGSALLLRVPVLSEADAAAEE